MSLRWVKISGGIEKEHRSEQGSDCMWYLFDYFSTFLESGTNYIYIFCC